MRYRLTLTLLSFLVLASTALAGTEVFTVSSVPASQAPRDAVVVELDKPARLDTALSEKLPVNREAAAEQVRQRLRSAEWRDTITQYEHAYAGLVRAWQLGVEQVPAVVVDGQYVVYGEPNVRKALAEIRAHQEEEIP